MFFLMNFANFIDIKSFGKYNKINKTQGGLNMDFTPEQRAYIDWKLKLAEETQLKNGNKLYPFSEVKRNFLEKFNKEEKEYRIRDI